MAQVLRGTTQEPLSGRELVIYKFSSRCPDCVVNFVHSEPRMNCFYCGKFTRRS